MEVGEKFIYLNRKDICLEIWSVSLSIMCFKVKVSNLRWEVGNLGFLDLIVWFLYLIG